MKNRILALLMLTWTLAFAGCKDAPLGEPTLDQPRNPSAAPPAQSHDPLAKSGVWRLATMTITGVTTKPPKGAKGSLQFGGGQVSGTADCNGYSGPYRVVDGELEFEGFLVSAAGCEHWEFESEFLGALESSTVFKVDHKTLILSDGTVENQLSFVRNIIHHLPLQGTDWSFFGFQEEDADTVATTLPTGTHMSIRFEPDGRVSGSIACNSFNGSAEIGGDGEIKIEMGDITEEGCSKGNASQEAQFHKWLSLTDSYQIQEKQLLLIDSNTRNSLVFRAR